VLPESTPSWRELLQQLKRPGSNAPKLAIGDGSLGFWIALHEEYGPVAQQERGSLIDGLSSRISRPVSFGLNRMVRTFWLGAML
jgi:hypothetical protein